MGGTITGDGEETEEEKEEGIGIHPT